MLFKQFLNRFSPLLFGYDIFISYRRADAGDYAEGLALALQEQGLICFLDLEETVAGVKLSPALKRALRRSRMLVVILTPGILQSDWVAQEVETFLHKPNRLVPINIDRFLSGEDINSTLFAQLRELSWLDDSKDSLQSGNPRLSLVQDIQKSHRRWLRVRTMMRLFVIGIAVIVIAGGYRLGSFVLEEQRHAQVAYGDIHRNVDNIRVLLKFMIFASQNYAWKPLDLYLTREESFEVFKTPEVVKTLEKLDLAKGRTNFGPFIGFEPISNPGDRRSTISIVVDGAQRIASDIGKISQQRLPLANRKVLELVNQLANHKFLSSLVNAQKNMSRYHEIEDSYKMPYFVLGNPGTSSKQQYLDFVSNIERLRSLL